MDKRILDISFLLSEYSRGLFDSVYPVTSNLDDVDAIGNGINMLGEELKSITISRNYFNNIFNSVTDMVLVLEKNGTISDANKSAIDILKFKKEELQNSNISSLHRKETLFFKNIMSRLKTTGATYSYDGNLYTKTSSVIPARITITRFSGYEGKQLFLFTATDFSFQRKAEKMVIRAIIDTQESERQRLAKDLHDSLSQQLSAIKFYISSIAENTADPKHQQILSKSNSALTDVMSEIRNICFSLMPKTLEEFGLVSAVREFCNHYLLHTKVKFNIESDNKLPHLTCALKTDLYRVVQEFISNSIKHGDASEINIHISSIKKTFRLFLHDNGKGFDIYKQKKGMGLQNVISRIRSHEGEIEISSQLGKGTSYRINIPINKK